LLTDDAVRNELMEQLPVITRLCHPVTELDALSRFLPIIVAYLTDASSQVPFSVFDVHNISEYLYSTLSLSLSFVMCCCQAECYYDLVCGIVFHRMSLLPTSLHLLLLS